MQAKRSFLVMAWLREQRSRRQWSTLTAGKFVADKADEESADTIAEADTERLDEKHILPEDF